MSTIVNVEARRAAAIERFAPGLPGERERAAKTALAAAEVDHPGGWPGGTPAYVEWAGVILGAAGFITGATRWVAPCMEPLSPRISSWDRAVPSPADIWRAKSAKRLAASRFHNHPWPRQVGARRPCPHCGEWI